MNYDDDLFYGDPLSLKKLQLNKLKEQFTKQKLKPSIPNIKNLNDYFTNYNSLLSKPTDFETIESGKCFNFFSMNELHLNNNNKKEIEDNLNSISDYLNELNYVFKDEYGNLLIFSVCKNIFFHANGTTKEDTENYIKCFQRFIFVSKIDYSYYSFVFTGEKIPSLINFSVDFTVDEFSHKRFLFLFGGIDGKGNHNSDIFRFDIDYSFGNINVKKLTSIDIKIDKNNFVSQGLSEASYNVIQYKKQNLNYKRNYLSIIFGGNNDENISNKLYAYKHETSTWLSHDYIDKNSIIPRKGHSAVVTNRNIINNNSLKEEVIDTYSVVLFGGKSVNAYLNDIVIVKVFYDVLNDKFDLKYSQLENNKDIIGDFPEPREGHKSFIEGNHLFVYGGCNYSIKKCYFDSIYKINLKRSPFKWEKEKINFFKSNQMKFVNKQININNIKTNENISNLVSFQSAILSVGICEKNEDNCKNQLNVILYQTACIKENNENDNCFLESETTHTRFNWVYKCKKKHEEIHKQNIENNNTTSNTQSEENKTKNFNSEDKEDYQKKEFKQEEKVIDQNKKEWIDKLNILNSFLQNSKSGTDKQIETNKKTEKASIENLLKIFTENYDLNRILNTPTNKYLHKSIQSNDSSDKISFESLRKLVLQIQNSTNHIHKYKNASRKSNIKISNKLQIQKENEFIGKLEQKITENFRNTTLNVFEKFNENLHYYLNTTENSNLLSYKNIEKIIEQKFKYLENENLRLKRLIYNNEIKPLLKENLISNASINEINFLNFEEKIMNVSEQMQLKKVEEFKEKTINAINENCALTKKLQQNITEIKTIINKENNESRKNLNSLLKNLLNKIKSIDSAIERKFNGVTEFIKNQGKINNLTKEFLRKEDYRRSKKAKQCFNGFLLNETHCQCLPGFSGENCEIILTCEDNCSKNGVCHYGRCFCNPGFSGHKCEKKEECPSNCNNRGKCHLGKCYCDYGFSGNFCENKISCKSDCSNKGICFRGKCLCEPGWSGEDCSILAVKFNGCKNNCNKNGVCKMEKCFCYPGFSGKHCEVKNKFACPSNMDIANNSTEREVKTYVPCSGNGLCKYGMCFCYPGFKGKACDQKETCKNNCNNKGICINGKCQCRNSSKTDDCSEQTAATRNKDINYNNNTDYRKLNKLIKNKKNKQIYDLHFIQIDSEKDTKNSIVTANGEIKYVLKQGKENEKEKESFNNKEESQSKTSLSIIDEKTGMKYAFDPEGIHVGKETVVNIIYTALILLLLICSIILTMYLNKRLSNNK